VEQGGLTVVCRDGRTAEGQHVLDLTMQALQASLEGLAARPRIDATNLASTEAADRRAVEARNQIPEMPV
jgi:hypothetical protein